MCNFEARSMDTNLTFKSSFLKLAIISIFILPMVVFIPSAMAGSIEPRLQETLANSRVDDLTPVIIRLSDQANLAEIRDVDRHVKRAKIVAALKDKAEKTQGPLQSLLMSGGVADGKNLWLVNGVAVKVPGYLINEIASFPGVEAVVLDAVVQAPPVAKTTALQPAEWNISKINAPSMWSMGFTGQNIVVANMDTGVDVTHPAVNGSWRGGTNSWYNPYALPANAANCAVANSCTSCELNSTTPCDLNGHGTNTMGIMVGGVVNVPGPDPSTGSLGNYAIGVAPGAKWIGVKVLNDAGSGLTSIIIEGYQWVLDPNGNPAISGAPDIINNSWDETGPGCFLDKDSALLTAIQNVRAAEIAVVFAAGNDGANGPKSGDSPALYPPSFSVGSTNSLDVISTFSSLGPNTCPGSINGAIFPNIVSPGENVLVADPTISPKGYAIGAGTSYAAPHAAGALALLKTAFPNKKVADLETALMLSAVHLGTPSPNNTYGYGRIDVLAAYHYLNATQIGVFRSGIWYLDSNANFAWDPGIDVATAFGMPGDLPVVGNWNGSADGKAKIGVFRNGWWYLDLDGNGVWGGCTADGCYDFGMANDVPITGDWNGDGKTKIGVFRNGWWYLDLDGNGVWGGCTADGCYDFGMANDVPITGDWNGNGKVKIGVFRNGWWYLDYNGNGQWDGCGAPGDPTKDACFNFGQQGDIPLAGDWNGNGKVKIGVFRNGWWYLDYNGSGQWVGCGAPGDPTKDACFMFGLPMDIPVVGKW